MKFIKVLDDFSRYMVGNILGYNSNVIEFNQAIINGDLSKVEKLLTKHKVDINSSLEGYPPLIIAIQNNNLKL
ncbi:MAG: hypothetical protein DGJ47_000266 [Rickettsiaceae bacterium]